MANKKFSEFTVKTSTSDVDFVVGYDGTDNVRITPANLTGGGGASSLNGLTDCLVDTDSLYVGEVPAGLSGNPQANTILGIDAGNALTNGANNTLIGNDAGKGFTGGTAVFVGALAGEGTSTANATGCIAIGWSALRATRTGNDNIAIGFQAGRSIGNGAASNTMLGALAGYSNTGSDTVMVGKEAGRNNTATGHVSVGYQAGFSNTSGTNNTNIGYRAGYANTTGAFNVTLGYEAGRNNTGNHNTYLGFEAARAKTSGNDNTVVGFRALDAETTGQRNTAIGYEALGSQDQTAGAHNTAVGWQADDGNTNGYYRTSIGASTGRGSATGTNITNIGYSAMESSSSASNEINLGNSSVATLRCAVTSITSLSDERDKSEIKDLEYGLAFIDALQPREFVWDNRPETNGDGEEFFSSNKGKKDFGFIAQEVKELDNDTLRLVYDENPEKLELSYGKLVPVLVQAIKELKAEIELLKS
jgi:hypothetical protein